MLPESYNFYHGLLLNNFFQVWLIVNQIDHVPLLQYINQADDVLSFCYNNKSARG